MKYHPVTKQITGLLTTNDCWFQTFRHKPVKTSEEAAKIRTGYSLKQGAKALVIRVKRSASDKEFVMLVFPSDLKFDTKKVKDCFKAKDIRFATSQEITDLTDGVKIGGVPPFGNLFKLKVVVDPRLFKNEKIIFNAGDRKFSVAMKSADYKRLVSPEIFDIV